MNILMKEERPVCKDSTLAYQAHATVQRIQSLEESLKELERIANAEGRTISRKTGMLLDLKNLSALGSGQPITLKFKSPYSPVVKFACTVKGVIVTGTIQRKGRLFCDIRKAIRRHFNDCPDPDIKIDYGK